MEIIKRLQEKQGNPEKERVPVSEQNEQDKLPEGMVVLTCRDCGEKFLAPKPPGDQYEKLKWQDENKFCRACSQSNRRPIEIRSMINKNWGRWDPKTHDDSLIGMKNGPPVDKDGKQMDPRQKK